MAETVRKKRKKGKKKWIVLVLVLLLLALAAFYVLPRYMEMQSKAALSIYSGDIYTVTERTVSDTISATGLIESHKDTTKKVYSTLNFKIDTVAVALGDKVNAGDLLCTYETETLDRQIREKELAMTASAKSSALNLATAKLNYDAYRAGLQDGTNSTVRSAQSAYDSALEKYEDAKKDYEEYLAKSDSSEIITLNAAKRAMENAQKQYDDLKKELDEGTNIQLLSAKRSLVTARDNYETYRDAFEEEDTEYLVSAELAADKAHEACRNGEEKLQALRSELDALEDSLRAELAKPQKVEVPETPASASDPAETTDGAGETPASASDPAETTDGAGEKPAPAPQPETQDPVKISRLEASIAEIEEAIAKQESLLEELYDAYYEADDRYARVYASADATLKNYKTAYENAQDAYDSTRKNLENTLESYADTLTAATEKYTDAKEAVDKQIESYASILSTAERGLSDAENSLTNAKITTQNQLESYRIAYENAKNGTNTDLADFQLANLYTDLAKTKVTAPISGTVTAIYAKAGETANGVLLVIEDTENLVVTTTVKAYDLHQISEGMRVKIKTDASGNDVFYGVIESISPAAVKDATGSVLSTNDAEFETVVRITDKSELLRIGVSARIEYILDEAVDAVAVPDSAILTDTAGDYVLTVTENAEGAVLLSRTAVEIGVGDGIYTVVSGVEFGARVADNAEHYVDLIGQPLTLSNVDASAVNDAFAAMMQMRESMMGG